MILILSKMNVLRSDFSQHFFLFSWKLRFPRINWHWSFAKKEKLEVRSTQSSMFHTSVNKDIYHCLFSPIHLPKWNMFNTVSLGQGMCGLAVRHFVLTTEASACHVGLFCFFIFAARLSVSSLGAAVTFMWECTMASEVTLIHCQAKMLQWIFSPGFNICHVHLICNYISWQTPLIDKCVINATHSRHLITLCCFSFRVGP